ncbi:MAG: glycine zipper 2TM domain-containing protein [Proteobacteria bacterium]|nr:glycine zipper 2TM domain-containing protein [Pseudomonadota bacterium]MDE3208225.1 glycine zipper 2TM domain-containing protein [Pseudomonadota bacterium]
MIKKIVLILVSAGICNTAMAIGIHAFSERATVISSEPAYVEVNRPEQVCGYTQPEASSSPGTGTAGTLIGGLAGGLIGHQVGNGRGNTAATIAGAIGGAMLGNHVANNMNQPQQNCVMQNHWVRQPQGYRVTYRFNGHVFTDTLPYNPGNELNIRVSVEPAG